MSPLLKNGSGRETMASRPRGARLFRITAFGAIQEKAQSAAWRGPADRPACSCARISILAILVSARRYGEFQAFFVGVPPDGRFEVRELDRFRRRVFRCGRRHMFF